MKHDDSVPGDTGDSELERLRNRLQRAEELLSKAETRIRILNGKLGHAGDDTENEISAFLGESHE